MAASASLLPDDAAGVHELLPQEGSPIVQARSVRIIVGVALAVLVMMQLPASGQREPAATPPATTERLAGQDRFATAVTVSRRAFPRTTAVAYVADAENFPDALVAGALTDGPILLVPSDGTPPPVVVGEIARLDPPVLMALGGAAAVSEEMLRSLAGGRRTGRLAGHDRYATAAAVARRAFPDGAANVYLARGDAFPDALAAGTLTDGPILLVPAVSSPASDPPRSSPSAESAPSPKRRSWQPSPRRQSAVATPSSASRRAERTGHG